MVGRKTSLETAAQQLSALDIIESAVVATVTAGKRGGSAAGEWGTGRLSAGLSGPGPHCSRTVVAFISYDSRIQSVFMRRSSNKVIVALLASWLACELAAGASLAISELPEQIISYAGVLDPPFQ